MGLSNEQLREVLVEYAQADPKPDPKLKYKALSDLRRGRPLRRPPNRIALVERDGMLFWEWGPATFRSRRPSGPIRRASRRGAPGRKVIYSDDIPSFGLNQIGQMLLNFDCK